MVEEGLKVKIIGDTSDLTSSIQEVNKSIDSVASTASKTAAAVSQSFSKVSSSAKDVVEPVDNLQQAFQRFGQSLNNLDFSDKFDAARKRLNDFIDNFGKVPEVVQPGIKSISELSKELQDFQTKASQETDVSKLESYNKQIQYLQSQIAKLQNIGKEGFDLAGNKLVSPNTNTELLKFVQGIGKIQNSSYTTRFAVQNMSDVIRDIPFAANNPSILAARLDHVVASFGMMREEAGSTKGALQLLMGSLTGTGGLIIGFNLLSLAATSIIPKLFSSGETAQESSKKIDEYKKSVSDAFSSVAQEASKVEVLVAALERGNLTYAQRKGAIEELKRIAPTYFSQLDAEKLSIDQLDTSYKHYLASLQNAAEAKVLEKQLEDIISKRLELEKVLNPPQFTFDEQGRRIQNFVLVTAQTQKVRNQNQAEYNNLLKGEESITNRLAQLKPPDIIKPADIKEPKTKEKFSFLFDFLPFDPNGKLKPEQQGQLLNAVDKFQKEFGKILQGAIFTGNTNQRIKQAITFDAELKAGKIKFDPRQFKDSFKDIKPEDVPILTPDFTPDFSVVDKFIEGFRQQSDRIKGLNLFGDIDLGLQGTVDLFKTKFQQVGRQLPKLFDATDIFGNTKKFSLDDLFDTSKVSNKDAIEAIKNAFSGVKSEIQNQIEDIQQFITSVSTQGFSTLGEAIGTALAGGNLGSVFSNFMSFLGDSIEQLGKQMIALSPVIAALKAAIHSLNPALLLPAGIALVGIGAALKNVHPKGFAQGGLVFGPTLGLVGEGIGTSASNPEIVAPLNKLKDYIGGGSGVVAMPQGQWRISGKDLVFVMSQEQRSQNRNFGR